MLPQELSLTGFDEQPSSPFGLPTLANIVDLQVYRWGNEDYG